MSRSIQTVAQYNAEVTAWESKVSAIDAGVPMMRVALGEPPREPDEYSDRLAKYIPAEVITLYLTLIAAAATQKGIPESVTWLTNSLGEGWFVRLNILAFVIGLIATPIYLRYRLNVRSIAHLGICAGSFIVWAIAIPGGLFQDWPPVIRGFLLPLYTFGIAFYEPNQPVSNPDHHN